MDRRLHHVGRRYSTYNGAEMLSLISNGRDSNITFDQFPYYLSPWGCMILNSHEACIGYKLLATDLTIKLGMRTDKGLVDKCSFCSFEKADFTKHTRNLSPASQTILLSGPAEPYQQMLAKALAHYFEAKLLLLDVTDFSLKILSKYGSSNKETSFKRSISETTLGRMSELFGSFSLLQPKEDNTGTLRRQSSGVDLRSSGQESSNPAKLRRNASASANINTLGSTSTPAVSAPLKRTSSWCFDEKLLIQTLYKVLVKVSKICPIVLYLRDVENLLCRSQRVYILFQKMLKKLSGCILILGSRVVYPENDYRELEEDMKMIQYQDNRNHISEVLAANDLDCEDLGSICLADTIVLSNYIEEIVVSAISYHLMNTNEPVYRNGKLVISSKSLSHGLSIFQEGKSVGKNTLKLEAQAEMPKGIKAETKAETAGPESKNEDPPASKTPVTPHAAEVSIRECMSYSITSRFHPFSASSFPFSHAALALFDCPRKTLRTMNLKSAYGQKSFQQVKLTRPFEGGLLKPCRGILLFGPPGTGKTMLAKAIAKEAGASFINVSMSTITSKWFGEDEKNVRALFTLAAKVSPTIIFVDEVDSMLGQRTRVGEHEAMRKIKNEFMTHWDGLLTKPGERILVLAATNRPFDLDEAIIRRFERRIMVGLPSVENREKILRTLLSKEKVDEGLDFRELATMTEGYSGSDVKVKKSRDEEAQKGVDDSDRKKKERTITIRPLNMDDFKEAKDQVAASFASEGSIMTELKQWNDLYGEGGSRKKEQLSYFFNAEISNDLGKDGKLVSVSCIMRPTQGDESVEAARKFRHNTAEDSEESLQHLDMKENIAHYREAIEC
ncbi:hypothetical protein DH2020_028898 [Rehmannia glutinosa]|uniref:AAA+ ATPase domain-containing protein n=1 Tax=Rehmannia glutinosa TaxID=99300 RepID=A0ABR0VSU6_REHGL